MLVPLTRQKFEELIPRVSTGAQYKYYWGKPPDFLKRLLISIISVVVIALLTSLLGPAFSGLTLLIGLIAGFYWLWAPIYLASRRNAECRRYAHSGFLQGQVLDAYLSEELVGKEETVNKRGELVIVENRERRLNLEIGDETGFSTKIQVPLRREHQRIKPYDAAEMVVMSNRADLGRISKISDVYIPARGLWVSDYPYVRRDVFGQVSRALRLPRQPMIDTSDRY
jgi:hypothetical protein